MEADHVNAAFGEEARVPGKIFVKRGVIHRPETRAPAVSKHEVAAVGGTPDKTMLARDWLIEPAQVKQSIRREFVPWRVESPTVIVRAESRDCSDAGHDQGSDRARYEIVVFHMTAMLMQNWQWAAAANQLRVQVQVKIQPPVGFGVINRPRHQDVRRVMISF